MIPATSHSAEMGQVQTVLSTPRSALLAVFCAFGAMVGGFAGSFPVIMQNSGIGSFEFGLGTMMSMGADVVAMSAAGMLARRYSTRAMLLVFLPFVGVAGLAFMTAASATTFYVANIAYGAAMGGTDIFMNGEGSNIERDLQKPVFATFHAALSLTLPVFALAGSFLSTLASPWMTSALQIAMLAFAWNCVRRNVPDRLKEVEQRRTILRPSFRTPFIIIGVIAGICFASELSALIWSSQLLAEQAPKLAAIAGLGAAFFGLCNAFVRLGGDRIRQRFSDPPVLVTAIAVTTLGFALLSSSTGFAMSVVAFAIVGFGSALSMPCSYALAAILSPGDRVSTLSFVGAIAGLPRIIAPLIFGFVASEHGISASFGLFAAALAVALILALVLTRMAVVSVAVPKS